jgi:4-coumarate--CoA ligase (photoactive yellow protein activation family)
MIRDLLRHAPGAPVALGEGGARSAEDLLRASSSVARFLAGVPAGEVLLVCDDRFRFAAGLLGAWRAGRSVLLPPNGQPETIRTLAHSAGVVAFLHDRPGAPEGSDLSPVVARDAPAEPLPEVPPDRPVATLATSGTTGTHQRCPKTAAQLLGEARDQARSFLAEPGAVVLATVPGHHIYGILWGVLAPLFARGAFVRETLLQPEPVAAALARHGATHLVSVPAHLRALAGVEYAPPLRRIFSAGAPLPVETARAIQERFGVPVTELYGSSETGGVGWREAPGAPWRPFPGVVATAGADGRLLVESPYLAPGAERPFRTGDRIAPDGDGFALLGRVDGVVKVAGKRVALAEIEARCLALPGVRDAAALAVEVGGARGEEVRLAAVAPGWDAERLRAALSAWFDPATLPRRIRLVDALPREENGKITRARLAAILDPPAPRTFAVESESASRDGDDEVRTVRVTVPADLYWFRGHFDGHPVLPGVVQLEVLVLANVRRVWPDLGEPRRVLRLKFKRVVGPGTSLALTLRRRAGEPRVSFEIDAPAGGCASGSLVFAPGGVAP